MKVIEFMVDPQGGVEMEASGFKGSECLEATKKYEEALGIDGGERNLKAEYYEQAEQGVHQGRED